MSALRKQLTQFLSQYPQFKLVILLGSQATGDATAKSDIALALLAEKYHHLSRQFPDLN